MGIESVFACNAQNNKELEVRGEKRFRMLWQPMMSEVSHAQRLPRQRLSANRQCAHGGRLLLKSRLVGSVCWATQSLPCRPAESLLSETGVPRLMIFVRWGGELKDLRLPFV